MLTTWEQEYLETPDEAELEEAEWLASHDCGNCGRHGMVYDGEFYCRYDRCNYSIYENHATRDCWTERWL